MSVADQTAGFSAVADATTFTFDDNCDLIDTTDGYAAESGANGYSRTFFFPTSEITTATCNIVADELECEGETFFVFNSNTAYLYIGSEVPTGTSVVTLTVLYN